MKLQDTKSRVYKLKECHILVIPRSFSDIANIFYMVYIIEKANGYIITEEELRDIEKSRALKLPIFIY